MILGANATRRVESSDVTDINRDTPHVLPHGAAAGAGMSTSPFDQTERKTQTAERGGAIPGRRPSPQRFVWRSPLRSPYQFRRTSS
jgi:hypothetical protein